MQVLMSVAAGLAMIVSRAESCARAERSTVKEQDLSCVHKLVLVVCHELPAAIAPGGLEVGGLEGPTRPSTTTSRSTVCTRSARRLKQRLAPRPSAQRRGRPPWFV